jgi:prevent-host-death family protein
MHHAKDTYSLTDFKQNTTEHLERLRRSGRPEILTVNGKAEAVVMSPEAYDKVLELVHATMEETRAKIAVGIAQLRAGQGIDGETAMKARRARRDAILKAMKRAG